MTTIKDILNDLANDVSVISVDTGAALGGSANQYEPLMDKINDSVEEAHDRIRELQLRLIGE